MLSMPNRSGVSKLGLLVGAGACALFMLAPSPSRSQPNSAIDSRVSALESRVLMLEQRLRTLEGSPGSAAAPPAPGMAQLPQSGPPPSRFDGSVAAFPVEGEPARPCDPPFYLDASGIRHDKPECVRKPSEDCSRTFITGSRRAIRRCLEDTPNPYR
jgi:hypothetical protein